MFRHSNLRSVRRSCAALTMLLGAIAAIEPAVAQQPAAPSSGPEGIRTSYTSAPEPFTVAAPLAAPAPLPTGTAARLNPASAPALSPPDAKPRTRLSPPGGDNGASGEKPKSAGSGAATVIAGLVFVLGLFLVAAWLLRRGLPNQNRALPREAVATLGHIPFPGRQQGQLLRVGNKLVLVSFSNAGADVITEVTDPLEVDRLSGMCAQADPYGAVRSFRDVVDGFFREKPKQAATSARRTALGEEDDVV